MTTEATATTIYHNPACGTSRTVLAAIRARGIEPLVVEYLKTPLDADGLAHLLARMGQPATALIRAKEALYATLGLAGAEDAALIAAMAAHPILMNRPVVQTATGAALCRPADVLDSLLPQAPA